MDIQELPDSSPLLSDPEALRSRWAADGVLFFRDVISHDAVRAVREEYLARLKELDVVEEGQTESVWNGRDRVDGRRALPIGDEVWRSFVADPSIDHVVRTFLGEAPLWVPIVVHRSAPPLSAGATPEPFGARHQDGVFNYGIDFVTCWIPLMDIDDEVGGLAVVPGSHRGSLYPPGAFDDPDRRAGIPADAIADAAWRRPHYRAGDLLMFHSMTAHAGLPNRSDKLRLSMDIRFLPESVGKPLVGEILSWNEEGVAIRAETGEEHVFRVDARTVVRGPKGTPLVGEARSEVLFAGANIILVPEPEDSGQAKLIRSVSRKYIDLPGNWFATRPAGWVN